MTIKLNLIESHKSVVLLSLVESVDPKDDCSGGRVEEFAAGRSERY